MPGPATAPQTVFLGIRSAPPAAAGGALLLAAAAAVVQRFGGEVRSDTAPGSSSLVAAFVRPADALAAVLALDALAAVLASEQPPVAVAAVATVGAQTQTPGTTTVAGQAPAVAKPASSAIAFALHIGDSGVCSELLRLAHPGQVLLTTPAAERLRPALPAAASLRDLGVHRLRDLCTTLSVCQLLHPALAPDFSPLPSLDHLPHNLPGQLTPLVGRERDLLETSQLLASARLVTLTGAGGMGKTRLALQTAAVALPGWAQGAWLVELAPLDRAELLAPAVAAALGVREQPGESLVDALVRHLERRQLLLVLDNCEHLVAACAELAERLLRGCPQLGMLATSREPLGVPGERVWQVSGLAVSAAGLAAGPAASAQGLAPVAAEPVEPLVEYGAVQFFVQRAIATDAGFRLTAANAPAVARICRHLEGMPLAIELAAALVRMLSVAEIADRLEDGLGLLSGHHRLAPDRHRTLRQAIDWSHALLSEPEQVLLRRLAVFAGGFVVAAAEAVCAGDELAAGTVLPLLSQLADRSLVVRAPEQSGRCRLLEPVRQYAVEKLQAAGETAKWRSRHRDWYLALADGAEQELLVGPRQPYWLTRFQAEHGNVQAALGWSLENDEPTAGLELAAVLCPYWSSRAVAEGRAWLAALLPRVPERTTLRAKGLKAARVLTATYDSDRAKALAEECWSIAREVGDRYLQVLALAHLGADAKYQGKGRQARMYWEASLDLARAIGDLRLTAHNLRRLASSALERGARVQALAQAEEALALEQALGDPWALQHHIGFLGDAAHHIDDYRCAAERYTEAQKLAGERAPLTLGYLARMQGDYPRAVAFRHEAVAALRQREDRHGAATELGGLVRLAIDQGDLERAAAWAAEMEAEVRAHGNRCCRRNVLAHLGRLALYRGDAEGATALLAESLALIAEAEALTEAAPVLPDLCRTLWAQDRTEQAVTVGGEGLVLSQTLGTRRGVAACLEALAGPALQRGRGAAAATMLATAATLRAVIGAPLPPVEKPACDAALSAARAQLGTNAFTVAWTAGEKMTADAAVDAALAVFGLDREQLAARTAARGGDDEGEDRSAGVATAVAATVGAVTEVAATLAPAAGRNGAYPAGLSGREVEIVRLVARGLTDREVGASLYISPRTVGTHLRNIFAKVDVPGRTGLAAWAVRTGLAPSSGEPR